MEFCYGQLILTLAWVWMARTSDFHWLSMYASCHIILKQNKEPNSFPFFFFSIVHLLIGKEEKHFFKKNSLPSWLGLEPALERLGLVSSWLQRTLQQLQDFVDSRFVGFVGFRAAIELMQKLIKYIYISKKCKKKFANFFNTKSPGGTRRACWERESCSFLCLSPFAWRSA